MQYNIHLHTQPVRKENLIREKGHIIAQNGGWKGNQTLASQTSQGVYLGKRDSRAREVMQGLVGRRPDNFFFVFMTGEHQHFQPEFKTVV